MKIIDMTDAYFLVGLAMLCVGLGAYDLRWTAIAAGAVVLTTSAVSALRRGGE